MNWGKKVSAPLRQPGDRLQTHWEWKDDTIYFTSGGTESDNWALRYAVQNGKRRRPHIVTSSIEHHAILNTCKNLEKQGVRVTYLPVNKEGTVQPEMVERAIISDTVLVSVMYANNEIGSIQPIRQIGQITHRKQVLFHTDAVQAYGQIPIHVKRIISTCCLPVVINLTDRKEPDFYMPERD